jgi:hypothetical protein
MGLGIRNGGRAVGLTPQFRCEHAFLARIRCLIAIFVAAYYCFREQSSFHLLFKTAILSFSINLGFRLHDHNPP